MTSNNRNCIAGAVRMGFGCGNCEECIEETKFVLNGLQKKLEYFEDELKEVNARFKKYRQEARYD